MSREIELGFAAAPSDRSAAAAADLRGVPALHGKERSRHRHRARAGEGGCRAFGRSGGASSRRRAAAAGSGSSCGPAASPPPTTSRRLAAAREECLAQSPMTWSSFGGDLVALHGGRIEARSAGRGLGSEFVVRLPLSGERPAITEAVAKPERVTALGAGAVRVLVVDDNVDAASSLSQVLATAGYQTSVAHEGSRALELARQLLPAVVLLDIGLPDLSGHDIARRLRAEPW